MILRIAFLRVAKMEKENKEAGGGGEEEEEKEEEETDNARWLRHCHLGVRKDTGKEGWECAKQSSPTY